MLETLYMQLGVKSNDVCCFPISFMALQLQFSVVLLKNLKCAAKFLWGDV